MDSTTPPLYSRITWMCSGSTYIALWLYTSMTSLCTLRGWPNIATMFRRSSSSSVNTSYISRLRNVLSISHPSNSLVIISAKRGSSDGWEECRSSPVLANSHNINEIQLFLGFFSNFYWCFIKDYSSITPLTSLFKGRPKSLYWTSDANMTMNTLQNAFTSAPLPVHPDPNHPFIIEINPSTSGVGVVPSQQQGSLLNSIHVPPSSGNSPRAEQN